MDIDFIFDTKTKEHFVASVGEHTALVNFLNQCFGGYSASSNQLNTFISELESGNQNITLKEWLITQDDRDEVIIKNAPAESDGVLEDGDFQLMQWEYECHCGKQDLLEVLHNWSAFIESN